MDPSWPSRRPSLALPAHVVVVSLPPSSAPHSLEATQPSQLLGTSELNRSTATFAPEAMQDSMLAVAESNSMVEHFKNGIRHAGWLYKLVGKDPQDVNWKRYWVSHRIQPAGHLPHLNV